MPHERVWRPRGDVLGVLILTGLLWALLAGIAGRGFARPLLAPAPAPLLTETPQPTPTGGWWDQVSLTPGPQSKLPALPGVPDLPKSGAAALSQRPVPVPFTALACPQATARIAQIVSVRPGWWLVTGTATQPALDYWKMELSADGQNWTLLYRTGAAVTGGQLLDFNTRTVPPGAYQLRLVVVDKTGNYAPPCTVQITLTR